jgi:diguanylate cyclase (GGDEF)-like protein
VVPGSRELLASRVARALEDGADLTLHSVRLDGLDDLSDTLGADARETVMAEAAGRVTECLPAGASVVRLGVDELAVLTAGSGAEDALALAAQVLHRLRRPVKVAGASVVLTASVGIATGAADLEGLLRSAYLAIHQARNEGGDRACLYSPELLDQARQRLSIESELREAVSGDQLCVYYQPIVDTRTGEVGSVEALVRWNHPRLGVLAPPQFLGAAERAGLMVEIGRRVLENVCDQLVEWRTRWPNLAVAFNVSQAELMQPDFAEHVLTTLRRHGLPSSALHLEVTETVAVGEDGVACSLDDFGTGRSSLHRLGQLPVKRLKIDKSFVAEVGVEEGTAPLLASIVSLAHSVGRCVVAEGVETSDQAAFLTAHGCDELQGYLFSRPVPARELPSLLTKASRTLVALGAAGA